MPFLEVILGRNQKGKTLKMTRSLVMTPILDTHLLEILKKFLGLLKVQN